MLKKSILTAYRENQKRITCNLERQSSCLQLCCQPAFNSTIISFMHVQKHVYPTHVLYLHNNRDN